MQRLRLHHPLAGLAPSALLACLLSFFILSFAWPSQAVDWERMVMPGPLARGHLELEKDCAACHQAFDATQQRTLCLVCHEDVARDLQNQSGFHHLNALAKTGQCRNCHPDHQGRDADITGLSEATFDHSQTDYPLRGQHEAARCADCHRPEGPRRDAPSACIDCHRKDDAHEGRLSEDCGKCHDEIAWQTSQFDHDTTDYPLTGAHQKASCGGCHVSENYAETPSECIACHAIDDRHAGRFGPDCADCHTTATWNKSAFDHFAESGFALNGVHGKVDCASCHIEPPGERTLPENCSGCHAQDDLHAGRFGADCGTCHSAAAWSPTQFDHAKQTDFALRGAHATSACNACHTQAADRREDQGTNCIDCHRSDDVHTGGLGTNCADCHNEVSFAGRVRFEHDLTGFPLLGLHAAATCESCHQDTSFRSRDAECRTCHGEEDVHEKTLGKDCGRCHNPNGWRLWRFDHERETDFALQGSHTDLECAGCHTAPLNERTRMSDACSSCHAADDAHRGRFGRRCQDCHSQAKWKPAHFGRSRGTQR